AYSLSGCMGSTVLVKRNMVVFLFLGQYHSKVMLFGERKLNTAVTGSPFFIIVTSDRVCVTFTCVDIILVTGLSPRLYLRI
ncbi:hypothetical protein, partial [Psychrobacter sp. AOP7-B1-24]|uniref:hypothetical protein n=1 Tax=Psychrobacter sp. AOP7-B1-24 TaxID=3457645 RepID=UPI00402B63DD